MLFRSAVPMPAFKLRSGAADLIEAKGQPKATPQQYAAMPGIKPDEIKHSGFDALGTKAIPREQAAQHLRENAVPVEETQLGGKGRNTSPKFEEYSLPGGENYREVLLHLPTETVTPERARAFLKQRFEEGHLTQKEYDYYKNDPSALYTDETMRARPDYKSSHWPDVPNVLAHIRMSDRKGPNGEKVLHVEELQSDWGQQKREHEANIAEQMAQKRYGQSFDKLEPAQQAHVRRMVPEVIASEGYEIGRAHV